MQFMKRRDAPRKQRWHIVGGARRDANAVALMVSACGTYGHPIRDIEYKYQVPEGGKLCHYCKLRLDKETV